MERAGHICQVRHALRRGQRATLDRDHMQADPPFQRAPRPFDRFDDRHGGAEVVRCEDQLPHGSFDLVRMRPSLVILNTWPRHTTVRLNSTNSQITNPARSRSGNKARARSPSRSSM